MKKKTTRPPLTQQPSLLMPKRRQLTAETPKDDLRNAHDRALEVISSDAELPVDGILPRDEFDWIKTFIDENPPDVHAYRERPFRVTDEQRHALLRYGVHEHDIDACKNRQDLDILFSQAPPTEEMIKFMQAHYPKVNVRIQFPTYSKMWCAINETKKRLPPTTNQLNEMTRLLNARGTKERRPDNLNQLTASEFIDWLKETDPITDGQSRKLQSLGVATADMPIYKRAAHRKIKSLLAGQWQGSLGPCTPSKAKAIDQYMRKNTFTNSLCG